jgi:prepilin-type N-terminal cleavage/methylation domain-containing protein
MRLEPSRARGFTLLETLLALAIGGLVLTAAYGAVVRAAAARDGATRRTAGVARARLALLEMARTIESATRRPFGADAGELRIALVDPESPARFALDLRLIEQRTNRFATANADPGRRASCSTGSRDSPCAASTTAPGATAAAERRRRVPSS